MEQEVHSMKVCMFVILEIEFGIQLGGGEQSFNENNTARWFEPVRTFKLERFISTLICVMCYGKKMKKTFFFSRIVLPHDQQQRIRLIQTVTIKKAEIHSSTSLGNKVTSRWEGPQSLSCHKYSLSKDRLLYADSCVNKFV